MYGHLCAMVSGKTLPEVALGRQESMLFLKIFEKHIS